MSIKQKTKDFLKRLRRLFSKWTAEDCRNACVDMRYAAERTTDLALNAIESRQALEKKLEAAAYALSVIEAITSAYPSHFTEDQFKRINKLALAGYRAANKGDL